jgi:hypothetical protein
MARRRAAAPVAMVVSLLSALALATASAAAPYEPNDAISGATGPLLAGQTLNAALETPSDRDFFYFYVTSPRMPQALLTAQNLSGGGKASDIDVTIFDASATPLAAQPYIGKGETRVISVTLEPGKYYVEVAVNQGFGDAFSVTAGGGPGAFGTYAQIAGRCQRAMAATNVGEVGLERAEAKLQRAVARVRRSRYGTRVARAKTRAAHRKARARVRAKRRALREAREAQEPWCSIPA